MTSITSLFVMFNVASLLLIMTLENHTAYGFTAIRSHNNCLHSDNHHHPDIHTIVRASEGDISSPSFSGGGKDTFILSYDGVIANTAESKARLAIHVAAKTWPGLFEDYENENQEEDDRYDWLINKMMALSHVYMNLDDNKSNDRLGDGLSCDSVLLARMLWEEQLLDNDASVTCNGKYASRFHPSTSMNSNSKKEREDENRRRSRPLTVGEISVNWSTGALLRDTTRVKYNVDRKDPVPIIQQNLQSIIQKNKYNQNKIVKMNTVICDAIATAEQTSVYILAGHPSLISSIVESIQSDTYTTPDIKVITCKDLLENEYSKNGNSSDYLYIVSPLENHDQTMSQSDMIKQLLSSLTKDNEDEINRFHVVHSSLAVLNHSKYLFGDDSPRFMDGCSSSILGENMKLSLRLPLWADNIGVQQRNDAEMDAWLSVIGEDELAEMLSTRVITMQ